MWKTLNSLKDIHREILILKFLENLNYVEISDVLKIPEGTVATRINRAKEAFVKAWKQTYKKVNSAHGKSK